MKRNMLSVAIFLCAGIYAWNNFNIFSLFSVFILATGYIIWCVVKKRYLASVLCVSALLAGFLLIHFANIHAVNTAKMFLGQDVAVSGKVYKVESTDYGTCFYVKHSYKNKSIKICAYLNDEKYIIRYGDVINFKATLKIPDSGSGWGAYNKRMSLLSEGIFLETTGKLSDVYVCEADISNFNIFDTAYKVREGICRRIEKLFPGDAGEVLKGIITGDDSGIPDEVAESFRKSGVSHILVVSGMHVNIIVIISMYIMFALNIGRRKFAVVIQLLLVWFFVFMTGLGLSAIRAAIVITVVFMGRFISREADPINSLGFAAVIILVFNPAAYFSIGFRLSFLSTGAILFFAKDIRKLLGFLPGVAGECMAITLAAQIGTLPIVAQSFGSIGVYGVFTNTLICPVITLIVATAIISLILGDMPFIGVAVVWFIKNVIWGIIGVTRFISELPYSVIEVPGMAGTSFLIYALACAGVKLWFSDIKTYKNVLAAVMVLCCVVSVYNIFDNGTHITFLDTGSSDCTIIKNNNITIMLDGAGSDNYNVADSVIIPYMRKEGISKIDVAFVTHYHADHAKGVTELIEKGRIKNVVIPVGISKSDYYIFEAAQKTGTPLHYIGNNDKIKIGDVLVEGYNAFDGIEENNGFVYFATYGENRICIAGDVHKNGEKALVDNNVELKSDILKIPHHGSDTSGSEEFLKAVSPRYAVILRGDDKYPDENSKLIYNGLGIKYFSTNDYGNIRFYLSNNGKIRTKFGRNSFYELRNFKTTN